MVYVHNQRSKICGLAPTTNKKFKNFFTLTIISKDK